MLSNSHSFRNLISKKKSKVEPLKGDVSLDDLAVLVKRLSVQVDDLVEEKQKRNSTSIETVLPPPVPQSNHTRQNSFNHPVDLRLHTVIDPWASYVPQNYGALLQRLQDIESLQKCPNDCCATAGTVASADGVPWPRPIEPFQAALGSDRDWQEYLDIQYTHWCTLMRCLPLMDSVTSAHVKTVGLYAMREILKSKAGHKREFDSYNQPTTTKLRDSMGCLNLTEKTTIGSQDALMSTSETKIAIESLTGPIPPPKEASTPTPSLHHHSRFQKWVQYKKSSRKANTDTCNTPNHHHSLKKIGSWFF
ncbi:hypothetical protein INT48_006777 [Thamnidium elegans]|uniref:Uncharacterized protein n=1 Tax=Thamnidium elegans TaxID=101142 RepID=A0A8H7VT34_9FUNG|nr:hypothetical protein INT48_006777 [Thamnidium elegans]